MILIAALFSFSSARIQNTLMESQMLKALAVAEAGLQFAICELYQDPGFATHDLDANQEWTNTAKAHSNYVSDLGTPLNLKITSGTNGTYEGDFGEGHFKVRVGPINPTSFGDNPNTKNINEATCFLRIDSMGKVKDYIKHVSAVVMRRYPGREFLMYSGDVLSMVYGLKGSGYASQFNVFSTGHLYGHRGIEIGPVMLTQQGSQGVGTRQKLADLELLSSGLGGIFFYDPQGTPIQFRGDSAETTISQNVDPAVFQNGGNFAPGANRELGSFPSSLVDEKGNLV
ncbi:MAG TPA: hypothetical protein PKO06_23635, partial [Candidatus Ozemobacteraceae bacterium]|nr:hypothetical protein [Candidatus Ozemobacteraceae bacterium]